MGIRPALLEAVVSSIIILAVLIAFLARFGSPRRSAAVVLGVLLLDQLSQALAARYFLLAPGPVRRIPLLGGWMTVSYVQNWYLGFGRGGQDLLLLSLLLAGMLIFLMYRLGRYHYRLALLSEVALSLLIAGLLGILVDRLRLGYVVDFVRFMRGSDMACNLADLAALLSGCLFAIRGALLLAGALGLTQPAPAPAPPPPPPSEVNAVTVIVLATTAVLLAIWTVWPV